MNSRPLRKTRGRKPKWMSARPRRPGCRDCKFRGPANACRDPALKSGRCGDYVWFTRHGRQLRRRWVKPKDPRTPRQRHQRARLASASAAYSGQLTDAQQDACIAAGAKRQTRPRLGPPGSFTGHQYWVHKELKGKPAPSSRKTARPTQVPQFKRLAKKLTSQVPQPQALTRTTWGTHRQITGLIPASHRPDAGAGKKDDGRMRNEESRPPSVASPRNPPHRKAPSASEPPQIQKLTAATKWPGRANVPASPNTFRHSASHDSRPHSPRRRRHRRPGVVISIPQPGTGPRFGTFVKELRTRRDLSLREFCLEHGHDPSNWSKLEREVLPPPRDERTLRAWAKQLRLKPGSDDWLKFFDYAAVGAGRIPDRILADPALAAHLPALFRALSGQESSREDRKKLLTIFQGTRRP